MKHIFKIFFALQLLFLQQLIAQSNIVVNTTESGNPLRIARDMVDLKPGFNYKPLAGQVGAYKIDPTVVGDAIYSGGSNPSLDISTRNINTQCVVGLMQGGASVNGSGGATYNIPVSLPQGTNGMMPSLSINYNSQGGNGLLGVGWNISVGSAITRTGQTIYNNGKTEGILLNNNDNFLLDGQRLILNTDGLSYATEQESFSKITSVGTSGNGPATFLVETKDGKKIEYGTLYESEDNARLKSSGATVLIWYIRKVSDLNGNYFVYKYRNEAGQIVINEILYTGNGTISPYNKVKFFYISRIDKNSAFNAGVEVKNNLLVNKIEVYSESNLFRKYTFNYANKICSFLTEVVESGSDGSQFNSTVFQYGDDVQDMTSVISFAAQAGSNSYSGDYTGDGISDLLVEHMATGSNNLLYVDYLSLYSGSVAGTFTYISNIPFPAGYNMCYYGYTYAPQNFLGAADFNGDGKQDFVLRQKWVDWFSAQRVSSFKIYTSTGTSFVLANTYIVNTSMDVNYPDESHFQLGDYDGDGATDILTAFAGYIGPSASDYTTDVEWAIYYPKKNEKLVFRNNSLLFGGTFKTIDFDGDGKHEIMSTNGNNTAIYEITRIDALSATVSTLYNSGYPTQQYHTTWPADFNGDGKTDLLTKASSGVWEVSYSKGNSNGFQGTTVSIGDPNITSGGLRIADYNGDGKSDINYIYNPTSGPAHSLMRYSNGMSFESPVDIVLSSQQNILGLKIGDFNGDGKMDEVDYAPGYGVEAILYNKSSKELLIKKVLDSYNNISSFDYEPLTNTGVYAKTTTVSDPTLLIASFPMHVVSAMNVSDGNGGLAGSTYAYYDALVHKPGKGFLGFLSTISAKNYKNGSNNITVKSSNAFVLKSPNSKIYTLVPQSQTIKQIVNNGAPTTLFDNTYIYDCNIISGQNFIYLCQLKNTVLNDYVKGVRTTSDYSYLDNKGKNYGNITGLSIETNNVVPTTDFRVQYTSTSTSYSRHGTWVPCAPDNISVTNQRKGLDVITRQVDFTYNNTNGNVLTKTTDFGDVNRVDITYDYNGFGEVKSETISSPSSPPGVATPAPIPAPQISTITYDNNGRNITQSCNTLGQCQLFTYDALGRLTKATDITGLSTNFTYDGFGRTLTTTLATGVVSTQCLGWAVNLNLDNSDQSKLSTIYYSKTVTSGSPTTQTWYDSFGRKKKNQTQGFQAKDTYVAMAYDNQGNISFQSLPYFDLDPVFLTRYVYDDLNRVQSTTAPGTTLTGTTSIQTNYTYGAPISGVRSVKITSPQGTTTKYIDASGLVTSVSDAINATLNYVYYSSGLLKSVSLGTTPPIVSFTYDLQGNKIVMTDKNAGTINYTFDTFGRLYSQKNANDPLQDTYFTYNNLNQIKTKTFPKKPTGTITTTYNYNNSGVAINQLSSISNNDGMSMSYAYSSDFGRLQKIDQIINAGTPFTTQFQYDIYGNVKQKTYPGNFVVNNGYDLLGNLISITGTTGGVNTILWTKTDQNALGQTKGYTMGNGLVSSNTFDSYGNPQEFKVATSGIFDLKMNFDAPSGNLTSRSDVVESLTENFQYDALNRLKSSQVLTAQSVYLTALSTDYTPDGNGNIYKKSDAGTYTYDPNRVNAVTSIIPPTPSTPSTSFISQTPQDITYTAFNKVKTITEDANTNLLTISYGVDDQRCMQTIKQIVGGATTTKYYLPGYEKTIDPNNVTTEVNYINSPDGVCGMYVVAPGATGYYYVYKDHLGTPVTLTNSSGTVVYKQSFDAWGRRRNPHTWDYAMAGYTSILQNTAWLRGFTGHEMLPMFSLINMNGRIYDPISGRMLSPDNYIQSEGFSQSYNRYSYVWNNPLRYVDADGNYVSTAEIDWQQQMRHNQTIEGHNAAEFATQQGWGLDPGAAMKSSVMQTGYMESFRYLKYQAPGQGRQSYASDGEESKGLLFDVLDAIISATPVFGPIVMFAKAADRGDVFGAVAAVALGVLDMGAIASFGTAEYSAVSSAERSSAQYYVNEAGDVFRSTGYRAVGNVSDGSIMSRNGPTYITFDNISGMSGSEIKSVLQMTYEPSNIATFNTLQLIGDLRVPYSNWNTTNILEPLTNSYPQYGVGGATQAITSTNIADYIITPVVPFGQ